MRLCFGELDRARLCRLRRGLVRRAVQATGTFVEGFGEFFIDKIQASHIEAWNEKIAELIAAETYAPATINGWLSIVRVIMKAAKRTFSLLQLATDGVENFDTAEQETYPEEEPNALLPDEVPRFLNALRDLHPQHYAMAFLGLATGLRPSSLRPLRRSGANADVLWDKSALLVRRSQDGRAGGFVLVRGAALTGEGVPRPIGA